MKPSDGHHIPSIKCQDSMEDAKGHEEPCLSSSSKDGYNMKTINPALAPFDIDL